MRNDFSIELSPKELAVGRVFATIVMLAIAAFVLIAAELILAGIPLRP